MKFNNRIYHVYILSPQITFGHDRSYIEIHLFDDGHSMEINGQDIEDYLESAVIAIWKVWT